MKRTLDPIWNDTIEIDVDVGQHVIIMDLFDENRLTRDDFLGRVTSIIKEGRQVHHTPVFRSCFLQVCTLLQRSERSRVSGSLTFSITFVSASYPGEDIGSAEVHNNEKVQEKWLERNVNAFYLDPQFDILTKGQWTDSNYTVRVKIDSKTSRQGEGCRKILFNEDRGELTIPYSETEIDQVSMILNFLFGTSGIWSMDKSKDWAAVLRR